MNVRKENGKAVSADLRLHPIVSAGGVFAEGKPVRILGIGSGTVCAAIGPNRVERTVNGGRWSVELPPMEAGGPYDLTVVLNGKKKRFPNVYIGEVLLIAGQSNAEFPLKASGTSLDESVPDPLLRQFFVARGLGENGQAVSTDPLSSADGWTSARKERVGDWSAVGYLTARERRERTGKAVGIIHCSKGATVIESWLPASVARTYRLPDGNLHPDHTDPAYAVFNRNGEVYEKMLSAIMPYSLTGALWYQGESDTSAAEADVYAQEVDAFRSCLRSDFCDENLPFVLVQIADFEPRMREGDTGWTGIQRAQEAAAAADARTALVVSRDVCETNFIHPPTKKPLAVRIADALSALLIGKTANA